MGGNGVNQRWIGSPLFSSRLWRRLLDLVVAYFFSQTLANVYRKCPFAVPAEVVDHTPWYSLPSIVPSKRTPVFSQTRVSLSLICVPLHGMLSSTAAVKPVRGFGKLRNNRLSFLSLSFGSVQTVPLLPPQSR